MKKTIIVIIISFLILVTFSLGMQRYLEISSSKLVKEVEETEIFMMNGDIENGIKSNIAFEKNWDKTKKIWASFIDHYEIDNIEESVVKTRTLLREGEDRAELLSEIETLKFYISHIPKKEEFNLINIL